MKSNLKLLGIIFIIFLISCAQGNEKKPAPASHDADTLVKRDNSRQGELPPSSQNQKKFHDEMNDEGSLPVDSMKISLRTTVDTILGYRKGKVLIVEGDILIRFPSGGTKGVATTFSLWALDRNTNSISIPYTIDPNYKYPDKIMEAFKMWTDKLNNLLFVKRTYQNDYLEFIPSNNTQSFIGKVGGMQTVEIADWAEKGNIAHEIGHALGLYHEQSRSDRDNFVHILCNTDPNYKHAFKEDPYAKDIGKYDYYSIMHYPRNNCFEIDEKFKKSLPDNIPGQRDYVAPSDYLTIRAIYQIK